MTISLTAPLSLVKSGRTVTPAVLIMNTGDTIASATVTLTIGTGATAYTCAVSDVVLTHNVAAAVTFDSWTAAVLGAKAVTVTVTHGTPPVTDATWSTSITVGIADGKYVLDTFAQNFDATKLPLDWSERLQTAQRDMERETNIASFGLGLFSEKYDYILQDFASSFWNLQMRHGPIQDVVSYKMMWGTQEIGTFETTWLSVDKDMNMLELIPNALGVSGLMYTALIAGLTTIIPGFVMYQRIPCVFHVTFHAGLDFDNMDETQQDSFSYAIARRAILRWMPFMRPRGTGSESISIDGASQSQSFGRAEYAFLVETLKNEDTEWIQNIRNEFGTNMTVDIA